MTLHIRSLPDKFDKLRMLLVHLDNVHLDFVLICETFLNYINYDQLMFKLPGYNCISRHRKTPKCSGSVCD